MPDHAASGGRSDVLRRKPLQAAKFVGIVLAIVLAVAGFFRLFDASAVLGPLVGDGQFLALVVLPLVSLGLIIVIVAETLLSGYRGLRSERPIGEQIASHPGYVPLRAAEAGLALLGLILIVSIVQVVTASSTPAPAGVGAMLVLFAVGLGVLVASLVRSGAEIFVFTRPT